MKAGSRYVFLLSKKLKTINILFQDESEKLVPTLLPFAKSGAVTSEVKKFQVLVEGEGLKKVIEISLEAKVSWLYHRS